MKITNRIYLYFLIALLIPVSMLAYTTHQMNKDLEQMLQDVNEMHENAYSREQLLQELDAIIIEQHGTIQ